jgi:hypothetical protein
MRAAIKGSSKLAQADRWVGQAFQDSLAESDTATNFTANITLAESRSGTGLMRAALDLSKFRIGAQRIEAENAFDDLRPLVAGMDAEKALLAMNELETAYKRLPAYKPDCPLDLRLMLIRKIPHNPATPEERLTKKRADLEADLLDADIVHHSREAKLKHPWSLQSLKAIISLALSKTTPSASAAFNGPPGTKPPGDGKGGEGECRSCGKPGHTSRDCKSRCKGKGCGLKNCPGNYLGPSGCIMQNAVFPAEIKNARKYPSKDTVVESLKGEHKKRFPNAHAGEADPEAKKEALVTEIPPIAASATTASAADGTIAPTLNVQSHVASVPPPRARTLGAPWRSIAQQQRAANATAETRGRESAVAVGWERQRTARMAAERAQVAQRHAARTKGILARLEQPIFQRRSESSA